jgi:lycopene elongase/hydratase (dihydrobisanhydrobacterioruberin-forming)
MRAALKILADVLAYRLKKLEMANMVAAVALLLALRLRPADVVVRAAFALGLNLLVYLTNDYCDVERDLVGRRDPKKTLYLKAHPRAALGAQIGLGTLLAAVAFAWNRGLLVALVGGGGICWLYSAWLKRVPYADVGAMALWGAVMPLVAVPLGSVIGWELVIELGIFSASFELIQVARDYDEDRAAGVRTTAVALGTERCLAIARVVLLVSAVYAVIVLQRWLGLLLFVAPLLPVGGDVSRYWNRVRFVLGSVWLLALLWVFMTGRTAGLVHGW